jgi:hypothetical protein
MTQNASAPVELVSLADSPQLLRDRFSAAEMPLGAIRRRLTEQNTA